MPDEVEKGAPSQLLASDPGRLPSNHLISQPAADSFPSRGSQGSALQVSLKGKPGFRASSFSFKGKPGTTMPLDSPQGSALVPRSSIPLKGNPLFRRLPGALSGGGFRLPALRRKILLDTFAGNRHNGECCVCSVVCVRPYLSWIEGLTTNQYVEGSNPPGRTTFFRKGQSGTRQTAFALC